MARLCQTDEKCRCHSRCRHLVRGGFDATLQPEKVLRLEPVMGILVDFGQSFDSSGLEIDTRCGIHGAKPQPNVECSCEGRRYTAAEFIETLGIELRAAKMRVAKSPKPAGQPNRKRDGHKRLSLAS